MFYWMVRVIPQEFSGISKRSSGFGIIFRKAICQSSWKHCQFTARPWSDPELRLLSVWSFLSSLHVCIGFLWVPTAQKHAGRQWLCCAVRLYLCVNACMSMVHCDGLASHLGWILTSFSWLWIHHDRDQYIKLENFFPVVDQTRCDWCDWCVFLKSTKKDEFTGFTFHSCQQAF